MTVPSWLQQFAVGGLLVFLSGGGTAWWAFAQDRARIDRIERVVGELEDQAELVNRLDERDRAQDERTAQWRVETNRRLTGIERALDQIRERLMSPPSRRHRRDR